MKYITESGTERTCVCPDKGIDDEKYMCAYHYQLKYPDKEITKEIKINEL